MGFRPISDVEILDQRPGRPGGRGFRPLDEAASEPPYIPEGVAPPDVPRETSLSDSIRGLLPKLGRAVAETVLPGMKILDASGEGRNRARFGVMADQATPEDLAAADLAAADRAKAPQRTPGAVVGPTSPDFQPAGSSSVAGEIRPALGAEARLLAGGANRAAADVLGEFGVPGMAPFSERAAAGARRASRDAAAIENRLPVPVPSFTPNRLEQAASAVTDPKNVLAGVTQSVELAPAIAASLATRSPGAMLGAMRAITVPREYQRYKEEGLDTNLALVGSILQGESEAQPERIFASAILKRPIGQLLRGSPQQFAEAVRYVARAAGAEATSEGLSTTLNWMTDKALQDPTATAERLIDDLKQTAAQVAVQAPLMAGGARTMRAVPELVRAIEEKTSPGRAVGRAMEETIAGSRAVPATPLVSELRRQVEQQRPEPAAPQAPLPARARAVAGADSPLSGVESAPSAVAAPAADAEPIGQMAPDYFEPFKKATGKYPWEMPFEQFYKRTVSLLKKDTPGKPASWYEGVIRSEYEKAKGAAPQPVVHGGLPPIEPSHVPLNAHEQEVEARANDYAQNHTDEAVERYRKMFGNEINPDNVRELFPDYNASNEARSTLAPAVHEASSALSKEIYRRMLAEPVAHGQHNIVLFTAGGSGAGKTGAMSSHETVNKLANLSNIVFDSNMDNAPSATKKIDQAIAAGRSAVILYAYRDPIEAMVHGVLPRAMEKGRTVLASVHKKTHEQSQKAMGQLIEHYKDNPNVEFMGIDNSNGRGHSQVVPIEELLKKSAAVDIKELRNAVQTALADGEISETVARGVLGESATTDRADAEGARAGAGGEGGGESQRTAAAGEGLKDESGGAAPGIGEPFLVYRLGRQGELANRNAGNAEGVALHLARTDDIEKPQPAGGLGDRLLVFKVTPGEKWGGYLTFNKARARPDAKQIGREVDRKMISYSFPEGSKFEAEKVAEIPMTEIRQQLKAAGFEDFDAAGAIAGAKVLRAAVEGALAAPVVGSAINTMPPPSDSVVFADAPTITRGHNGAADWLKLGLAGNKTMGELGLAPRTVEAFGIRKPNPIEMQRIADAIKDVVDQGMPLVIPQSVKGWVVYDTEKMSFGGAYWDGLGVIGFGEKYLRDAVNSINWRRFLVNTMAHELTHHVDHHPNSGLFVSQEVRTKTALGAKVINAGFSQEDKGGQRIEASGPLTQEFIDAYKNGPAELTDYFRYPVDLVLAGTLTMDKAYLELTAQVGALYIQKPETVRKYLPQWFTVMEKTYGSKKGGGKIPQPRSLDEANQRLFRALQDAGARQPGADGVDEGAGAERARLAVGGSAIRGPPGARVGGGAGEAQKGAGERAADTGAKRRGGDTGVVGAQAPNPYWSINEPTLVENLRREWQDNKIDLKAVQTAIEQAAGTVNEPNNAYLADERYHGRVTALIRRFTKNAVEPLLTSIKDSGLTIEEVGRFLWARHAPERNAQMAKINPQGPANLSGLYDNARTAAAAGAQGGANAADILGGFSAAQRTALAGIAAQVDAITKSTRSILVSEGLEEQETINAWERAYKNYVPLMRDIEEAGTGSGFKIRGPESKRALGSTKEAQTIIAAVIAQHEKALIRAEKADVGRRLIKLAEDNPQPDFWRVDQPPMKRSINPTTGLVQNTIDPQYKNRDDVFIVKAKDRASGKVVERVLAFNEHSERAMKLSAAMQNLDVVQLSGLTKVVGKVTRIMANLATSWNPVFWATNAARDVQTAAVNLQSTPLSGHAPVVIANIPKALAGILSAEFRNGSGQWAALYRQFESEGGKTGWMTLFEDLVNREKELIAEIKASQRGKLNPLKWGSILIDTIDKANSAVENATRLSAFAEGVRIGMSPRAAASLAKNLTVNFNRKGNRSSATNAWYMFANASVQGTARLVQAVAKSPKAQAMVGGMVAFAAAMEIINRIIGDHDRDEDGNNLYELIDENVKQKSMIFMVPGSKGNYVQIPLPYGFNVFSNAGRLLTEAALGASDNKLVTERRKPVELAWNFAQALIDSFLPLGHASSPGQLIAPSLLDPVVQFAENKTWFGAPMRPEPLPFGPSTPDYKLFFRSTSDTAKDLARWLSDTTGGDEVRGGSIDVSPTTLAHIFSTVTGGSGRFVLGMLDFTNHAVGRIAGEREAEDMPYKAIPFVGKFYGEVDERDRASKFYRLRNDALETMKQVKDYRKTGEHEKADALEEEKPELISMAREIATRQFQKEMKGMREDFKAVDEMPREERARARRELQREEATIMSRALRAYNEELRR